MHFDNQHGFSMGNEFPFWNLAGPLTGDAENARLENAGRSTMQGWKMQEHLVWKALSKNMCQCYHIAVQIC